MNRHELRRIFVYGTLKRGYCRHYALADAEFLCQARTATRYRLLDLGDYPGLIEVEHEGRSISGELYAVAPGPLQRLDEIEGVDVGLYARRPIELLDQDLPTEAYFFLLPPEGYADCGERWK